MKKPIRQKGVYMMLDRVIHFKIGDRDWTDDTLMVCIPCRYADMFDGVCFKNMAQFSRALAFASCAAEAFYYDRPWLVVRNENSLRECLRQQKEA